MTEQKKNITPEPKPGYGIRGTSFYWYEKREMPEEEKKRIRQLIKGEPVGTPVFQYKNVLASYTHLYNYEL